MDSDVVVNALFCLQIGYLPSFASPQGPLSTRVNTHNSRIVSRASEMTPLLSLSHMATCFNRTLHEVGASVGKRACCQPCKCVVPGQGSPVNYSQSPFTGINHSFTCKFVGKAVI